MLIQQWFFLATLLGAGLSGCASVPADHGRDGVALLLKDRGYGVAVEGDAEGGRQLLTELLGRPLSASDAVRVALVNNSRLKAEFANLGFAAAAVYDAGRLSNPRLSASVLLTGVTGFVDEHSFGLVQSFTSLLLLPARSRFAEGEFDRVKQFVGAETLNLAAETESAHYRFVGAVQTAAMRESVARAAQASAELAQRFFDAGNTSRLELSLEQGAASQARLDLLQAHAAAAIARSDLNILMGLPAQEDRWSVEDRLPAPAANEDPLPELFSLADTSRLDLAAARRKVELYADALGVTRQFRYLGNVDVGVEVTRISEGARLIGPTLSLELPIFNQGKGRVVRSEAQLARAEAELRALDSEISNGVRRAATEVAAAKDRAEQFRQSLIPLRETIVARTLEEVNFMLKGQFELLLAKQQEYDAYQGYLEAVRDYWLARVELARQIGAPLPSQSQAGANTVDVESLITPKDAGMGGEISNGGMGDMKRMESTEGPGGTMDDMNGMEMPQKTSEKTLHGDHQ